MEEHVQTLTEASHVAALQIILDNCAPLMLMSVAWTVVSVRMEVLAETEKEATPVSALRHTLA